MATFGLGLFGSIFSFVSIENALALSVGFLLGELVNFGEHGLGWEAARVRPATDGDFGCLRRLLAKFAATS